MEKQRRDVIERLEAMDAQWRESGIPDSYKQKWGVTNNVGLWICGRETGEFLHQEVLKRHPISILELGTSVGYSTVWLADAAQEAGGHVVSLERETYKVNEAREVLAEAGLTNVEIIQCDIDALLPDWKSPIDFVFMDANKRSYLKQLQWMLPHLTDGAVVIADNVLDMAAMVDDFMDAIKNMEQFEVTVYEIGHGLAVLRYLGQNRQV